MPDDRAMLTVTNGSALITVDGEESRLDKDADRYVGAGARIATTKDSAVRLVFRGGAASVLCADTSVTIGDLLSPAGHPIAPTALLTINRGRLLTDTSSSSGAFRPLTMTVNTQGGALVTAGAVRLTVEPGAAQVASGAAALNGTSLPAGGPAPACGDGTSLPVGSDKSREQPPVAVTDTPSLPSLSPSDSASSSSESAEPTTTRTPRPGTTTTNPGNTPPVTTTPPTTPPTSQPTEPPVSNSPTGSSTPPVITGEPTGEPTFTEPPD
jgi:putative peptide zinc metalloprotease protein